MIVDGLFASFRSVVEPGSPVRRRAGEVAREVAGALLGAPELERARVELGEAASEGVARDTSGAVLGGLAAVAGLLPLGAVSRLGKTLDAAGDVGRIASATGRVPDEALRGGDLSLEGLRVGEMTMEPSRAGVAFGAVSRDEAQRLFDAFGEREPLMVLRGEDLDRPSVNGMLERVRQSLIGRDLGRIKWDSPEFTQFQPFLRELGLDSPALLSGKKGQTYRPMLKAIVDGDFAPVREDLAKQINNVFRLIDDEVFYGSFYPFTYQATLEGALRSDTPAELVSALGGVFSAGSPPIVEATNVSTFMDKLARPFVSITKSGAKLKPGGPTGGTEATALKAYVQMLNNPDWMGSQVLGLQSKTYVYSLLKLNPRLARALVVDRVDSAARLGAFELDTKKAKGVWQWATEGSDSKFAASELGIGNFAERTVAAVLGVPPWAIQENVWAVWRVLRDLQAGSGTSRSSSVRSAAGKMMVDFLSQTKMPAAHKRLYVDNLARLRDDVASGGAASEYWQFSDLPGAPEGLLIPRTDMPLKFYLPPGMRSDENIREFSEFVTSAEKLGEELRKPKGKQSKVLAVALPWLFAGMATLAPDDKSLEGYV